MIQVFFFFLSKLEEKVYTDGRVMCRLANMNMPDKIEVFECANHKRMRSSVLCGLREMATEKPLRGFENEFPSSDGQCTTFNLRHQCFVPVNLRTQPSCFA